MANGTDGNYSKAADLSVEPSGRSAMTNPLDNRFHEGSNAYCGKILTGDYSQDLKDRLAEYLDAMTAFDRMGTPAIPYLAAWENRQKEMWYEFASGNFLEIMDCSCEDLPEVFRGSVVDRRVYTYQDTAEEIRKEDVDGLVLNDKREAIRAEGTRAEYVEAVYKISRGTGSVFWLKDEAVIEAYEQDGIFLSKGCLTLVTKEMEAEDARERAELERLQREKLQGVLEMAGAVCHELNQPVMAITGYADIIAMQIDADDPLSAKLDKLKNQALSVGTITQKLMKIAKYRTKNYAKGEKIVDIEASSEQNGDD